MNFKSDASIDGKLVYGYEDGWHQSKNKGGYNQSRDFFWVHWEIGDRAPNCVKLHVECPNVTTDPDLNAIKHEIVQEFLSTQIKNIVEQSGFIYKMGNRVKPEPMKKFKCTSPFHVILTKEQSQNNHQANIQLVNRVLGEAVSEVVQRFEPQLNHHFPA